MGPYQRCWSRLNGRVDYAKGRAEQLAKEGFAAMAIDLYGGQSG